MTAEKKLLKIAGICGILTPIVAFSCIFLAISLSPWFSWTNNALSDLGVREAAIVFNGGLITAGILSIVFATGLWITFRKRTLGRIGGFLFYLGGFALAGIGVFSEAAGSIHFYFSVAFFVLVPLAMLFIAIDLIRTGSGKFGLFTIILALIAFVPWIFKWDGVAIPEFISSFLMSIWSFFQGIRIYLQTRE